MTDSNSPHSTSNDHETGESEPRIIRSAELFEGQKVVVIEHDGTKYRLLITRNNRLILHK